MLRQNAESSAVLFISVFMTLGIVGVALIARLLSYLFRARLSGSIEKK